MQVDNYVLFFLKGHEESYNPPPEYLPTEEEVKITKVPP